MRTFTSMILRLSTLLVWSGFLTWLMVSGEVYRYIGARTRWVVVFGALILALAALAQAWAILLTRAGAGDSRVSRGRSSAWSHCWLRLPSWCSYPSPH